jgi:uncharacterized protein YdhG (YjbR/CyaY superfamily)
MATSEATTVAEYLAGLPEDRRRALRAVRAAIRKRLPRGYVETMQYGMISYVVPQSILGKTYNNQPLALASLGNQKHYMSLYLNNVYGDPELETWFRDAYAASGKKLDMGKSCVRFKTLDALPLDVVGDAIAATPVGRFVARYLEMRGGSANASRPRQGDRSLPVEAEKKSRLS